MSELTPCNRCTVNSMKARARKRGVELVVEVVVDPADELRGWTSARYSDEQEPAAWFMVLTHACAC